MRALCIVLTLLLVASVAVANEKEKLYGPQFPPTSRALDCTNAIPIGCGQTMTGDNTGMPNNVVNYGCTSLNENGGEVVYELTLPPPACYEVTVTMTPQGCDLDLFFLGSCDESDCLYYSGGVSTEVITTGCLVPGTYYIVVDGYGSSEPGAECPFTIQVECIDCECPEEPCCPFPYECYVADFNTCSVTVTYVTVDPCVPTWEYDFSSMDPDVACNGEPTTTVLATMVNANYFNEAGEIAIVYADSLYSPFHISVAEHCWCLELCHWYDIETHYDGGNVKVSTDGGLTWQLITPAGGYPDATNSWPCIIPNEPAYTGHPPFAYIRDCFDLSAYDGMDILVGFFFGSDSSVNYPGWYIKWIKIGGPSYTPVEDTSWGAIKAMYR